MPVKSTKFNFALAAFVLSVGFFAFSLTVFQTIKAPESTAFKKAAGSGETIGAGAINSLRDRVIEEAQGSGQTEYSYEFPRPFPFPL